LEEKMTLPQTDLDRELIDEERLSHLAEDDDLELEELAGSGDFELDEDLPVPTAEDPTQEDIAAMATGFGQPRARTPGHPAPDAETPMSRTREQIDQTIKDIASRAPVPPGTYAAVEKIIHQHPELYNRIPCTPEYCPIQRAARRSAPAVSQRLIADVRPPIRERLAIVEHEVDDINQILGAHQESLSLSATRDELKDLEHKVDKDLSGVTNYIKTDVLKRLDKVENRSIVKNVLWGIALFITSVYSIIMTYEVFKR
jgi:hypothetical protein